MYLYVWLKALTNRIGKKTLERVLNMSNKLENELSMEAYIEVIANANINELKGMKNMRTATLDRVFGELGFIHIDAANENTREAEKRAQAEAERAQAEAERAEKAEARIKELEKILKDIAISNNDIK